MFKLLWTSSKYGILSFLSYLISGILICSAEPPTITEYQLKAIYLLNFAKFIQWPPTTFTTAGSPYQICILGEDPFQQKIDLAVKNEKIQSRSVKIQRFTDLTNLSAVQTCHILFISRSAQSQLTTILTQLRQWPVLTVSDIDNFVVQGGMIGFYLLNKTKVRFSIDPQTLSEVGIRASAQLLQIANIIRR